MDIIKLLPEYLANQIAAGEVVQRPSSVVKELLENSIDADATKITLIVKEGGKELIQVIDNGKGMSETDARMCFERHATSKISQADDIYAIKTLGFRGEAMASIAAVSQVLMQTRMAANPTGITLKIEGSDFKESYPCACAEGTSIAVKNIFYNVPARRNFLKSIAVENRHIIDAFIQVAMAYPHIYFNLYNNDVEVFNLQAGIQKQRIVGIMGNAYQSHLLSIEEETNIVNIKGFAGKPETAKKTRGDQYIFVNNRFIKSPYLQHAVAETYKDLIGKDQFPSYVLFLEIDPSKIDINVHPTKHEIKFEDERSVYAIVSASFRKALGQYSGLGKLDFDTELGMNNTFFKPINHSYNNGQHSKASNSNWETLYTTFNKKSETNINSNVDLSENIKQEAVAIFPSKIESLDNQNIENVHAKEPFQILYQYIIFPLSNGLLLIDQVLAHQRILFERFKSNNTNFGSQQLMFPKTVQFTINDTLILDELLPSLQTLGFDIDKFGKNEFIIRGLPSGIEIYEEQQWIEHLLEQYKNTQNNSNISLLEQVAKSTALHTSIRKGKALDKTEMHAIVDELFACEQPSISPFGKKIFKKMEGDDLATLLQ